MRPIAALLFSAGAAVAAGAPLALLHDPRVEPTMPGVMQRIAIAALRCISRAQDDNVNKDCGDLETAPGLEAQLWGLAAQASEILSGTLPAYRGGL